MQSISNEQSEFDILHKFSYTNNMKLAELIENIMLDRDQLSTEAISQVVLANYRDRDLVELIRIFLRGIGSRHQVPGDLIYHLADIAHSYEEFGNLTPKQRVYVLHKIIQWWPEVGVEMRATLGL
jgi:predicted DNA-binding ribbon-helix-helix protein